ncbi:hypothetical protein FMM05_00270 [Flavobacterium zepuense]|uniref:ATP-grasp domain-containing protein n=1 Tax=Flavobacterium zepuense TaxID=2593302 RepID=A0A552V9H7_9FLAO|nr:hypothetical protein [Flavobacterium zepuense]TRW27121.1 hypothetical protein FMM05_00270 [Flavobacterium zepuense]
MMSILIITNKNDITSDFIVQALSNKDVPFYRLNTDEIGNSIQLSFNIKDNQFFIFDSKKDVSIDLLRIRAVYFRRPEIIVHSQGLSSGEINFIKSELWFTLEALYKILNKAFWINTVDDIRRAENKVYQLLLAQEIGFDIPNTILTNKPESAKKFYDSNDAKCIIKPIKSGLIAAEIEEGVIFTSELELDESKAERVAQCPVYLQNLITKTADLRITVVGNKIFGALIHSQVGEESSVDWRRASHPLKHSVIDIPEDIKQKCLALTKKLNLNFGAIDFILDQNQEYVFLEINPNGQWAWIERQLNFNISDEITSLLVEESRL